MPYIHSLGSSQAEVLLLRGHSLAFLDSKPSFTQHPECSIYPHSDFSSLYQLVLCPIPPSLLTHRPYFFPPSPCALLWGTRFFNNRSKEEFKSTALTLTTLVLDSGFQALTPRFKHSFPAHASNETFLKSCHFS